MGELENTLRVARPLVEHGLDEKQHRGLGRAAYSFGKWDACIGEHRAHHTPALRESILQCLTDDWKLSNQRVAHTERSGGESDSPSENSPTPPRTDLPAEIACSVVRR